MKQELSQYIYNEIFPIYQTFDKGHDLNHILAVVERALKLGKQLNVNQNIVYAVAAYHDIGIKISRKDHATYSGEIVRKDKNLFQFFSAEEIEIIAQAVEDHSTSKGIKPRSIYGKIVCDADKDDNIEVSLLRAYEFTKHYFPAYSEQECIDNVYKQLCSKFGTNGKVKFWIENSDHDYFIEQMSKMANDYELFKCRLEGYVSKKKVLQID